ncbi:MAG: site-specific DNA-methyltransferase, partial [Treponema sp.]|nr:site-specific DNA-methyltransferase [Treponema sp.]
FCGSGTALIAARELNRNWIGIDKSEQAIKTTKNKLKKNEKDFFYNYDYSYIEVESNYELKATNKKDNRKVRRFA